MKDKLLAAIYDQEAFVVELQTALTAIPALGPENGGQGEWEKARLILNCLNPDSNIIHVDAPDSRVESGKRPNIVSIISGKSERKLWLFGHLDVVPSGDETMWTSSPWQIRRDGDRLYGRGSEDNQQAIVSMLVLSRALQTLGLTPNLSLGLVFMADEECGSRFGLAWLLSQMPELFGKEDFFIVPDSGSATGKYIEIAEKAQLWLKFTVTGKQCHASTPQKGINAFVAASALVLALNALNLKFTQENPLFNPPVSTFTPTRHPENVEAVNIIPGKDVFFMDCRLLPEFPQEQLLAFCKEKCREIEDAYGVKIRMDIEHNQPATSISLKTPILAPLEKAIKKIYGVDPRPIGIGGATVASFLRLKKLPAVVWSCLQNTCHQPDEYSLISSTLKDAAVFAELLMA